MPLNNDNKFFTNEDGNNLYERFCKVLKTNTQFFDVLVGYFRTSGFFMLYPAMENIEKIRILVGLNVDKYTMEIIDSANKPTLQQSKDEFVSQVVKEFEKSPVKEDVEKGVRLFIEWLERGKLEMRMYVEAPIHAKVYIMRKDQERSDIYGSVITGSSNFSENGLKDNLEFNVELRDRFDVDYALEHFESLWKDGMPITEDYIDAVKKRTWLRDDITPYEIYLKTLYEFFREEINADKSNTDWEWLPEGYMRLQYQVDAVVQAEKILRAYNGVFISDVVGLGKTYICALLARRLGKGDKLFVCPPVLVNYWQDVLLSFGVAAKVVSLGKLEDVLRDKHDYKYVFIDEAHRFRNAETSSFGMLHEICFGKKVILISATPINNYTSDIENQLYLFQSKHNSNIVGVKNLEGFFAGLESKLKKLKKDTPEYMAQLRENSEVIRDKIIRHVMIRRTRTEIEQYYHDDIAKQGLSFPKLGAPEKIIYTFDDRTDKIFNKTIGAIKDLSYARYRPITYLKDPSAYATMLTAQHNMGGFMKGILVKRLESSFYAFKMTLFRFIESYERFIDMYNGGDKILISKKVDVYDLLDSGDIGEILALVEGGTVIELKKDDFRPEFILDLNKDLTVLKELYDLWSSVSTDPKLEAFFDDLQHNPKLSGVKKIIFTESKETAEYLEGSLRVLYGDRVVSYSASSGKNVKSEIEYSFNPKYEDVVGDKFDVLITTDVLSEGINLHRSNIIVNYDLPWNPTKIMQRVGRVNRVGTKYDEIFVFNFFPTAQSSREMPLEQRIMEKLQAFHDTLGEDYKYLSGDEVVSSQKLFENLTGDIESEDSESINPELAYLNVIRKIRDEDISLFEKIKKIPKKAKAGRESSLVAENSTISFIRKGSLKTFYKSGHDTRQLSFIEAIKYIECDKDEQSAKIGREFYDQYDNNNGAFDGAMVDEIIDRANAPLRGNDMKVYKYLMAMRKFPTMTEDQIEIIDRISAAYTNGDIPQNITKALIKNLGDAKNLLSAYYDMKEMIPDDYLYGRVESAQHVDGEKQVVLSCYLKEKTQ